MSSLKFFESATSNGDNKSPSTVEICGKQNICWFSFQAANCFWFFPPNNVLLLNLHVAVCLLVRAQPAAFLLCGQFVSWLSTA